MSAPLWVREVEDHERHAGFPEARGMTTGGRVVHAVRNVGGERRLFCAAWRTPDRWRAPEAEVTCRTCWAILREADETLKRPRECPQLHEVGVPCPLCSYEGEPPGVR